MGDEKAYLIHMGCYHHLHPGARAASTLQGNDVSQDVCSYLVHMAFERFLDYFTDFFFPSRHAGGFCKFA